MLMALPRNMVKVFFVAILMAFGAMIWVVYTGKDMTRFLSHELTVNENIVSHPLFYHLQQNMAPSQQVESVKLADMDSVRFYQDFLTQSKPVLVSDGCKAWKAYERWGNLEYLEENYGAHSVNIHMLDKGKANPAVKFDYTMESARRNDFSTFLKKRNNQTEKSYRQYFLQNEYIVANSLKLDFERPEFITKIIRNRKTGITIWSDFRRMAEFMERERYFCVVSGKEEFRLASPVYK